MSADPLNLGGAAQVQQLKTHDFLPIQKSPPGPGSGNPLSPAQGGQVEYLFSVD